MKNLTSENSHNSIHQDEAEGQCAKMQSGRMKCVFVHGWGMNSAVWQSFIKQLPDYIEPVCIDLPGHGQFNQLGFENLQDLVEHLLLQSEKVLTGPAIWVGWSLGALPVLELARQQPERVEKVCLIASNPCFVIRDSWQSAVEESVFDVFADNLQQNIEKTLQRFLSLQVRGMAESRDVLRVLRAAIVGQGLPSSGALSSGLTVLKSEDLRARLASLSVPQCWLLGEHDTLVPSALNDYLSVQAGITSHIISGSAHLPFISHTEEVMRLFLKFIND
ncbi:MAG: pimeloyl-ACP methyl ester esterase BioH [Gammaproteobacteria bacterium]|nr:pimeloyl-ACP methyl ester esterase BioH [Gammaproteobacteria bacterium]